MAMHIDQEALGDDAELMMEMNTTPLIDVMLVLLVMLIITIPVQLHTVSVDMPSSTKPNPDKVPQIVRIDISAAQQIFWNAEYLPDRAALEARLLAAAQQADPPEIHVNPSAQVSYALVTAVLASAQRTGLQKVGIVGADALPR
jgi:biopolymer transport protein ExbD